VRGTTDESAASASGDGTAGAGTEAEQEQARAEQRTLLRAQLLSGLRSEDRSALRRALHLGADAGELTLACGLARGLSGHAADAVHLADAAEARALRAEDSRPTQADRGSLLLQLEHEGGVDLEQIEDVRTLLSVARAGRLSQRRAAVLRIGEKLAEPKGIPAAQLTDVIHALVNLRKLSIAYELSLVCSQFPGADGRRARHGRREWEKLASQVERQVRQFWDGAVAKEPLRALHGDQRMQLLVRTRDLPEVVVRHLAAVIQGTDGVGDRPGRLTLLGALRNAGDPRLLPALRATLWSGEPDLAIPAARALGRIDDPRVRGILGAALERTAVPDQRLVIGGALGLAGDGRILPYAREVLVAGDDRLLPCALEAIGLLGNTDDVQRVGELVARKDPTLRLSAVDTLARIGDGRALAFLGPLSGEEQSAALRAEVEEAIAAIRARMELLGEEPPSEEAGMQTFDTTKMAAMVKSKDPAVLRMRAAWNQALGYLWLALGMMEGAIRRFEAASALRPDWVMPVLMVARIHARQMDSAQALATFRRALAIDRDAVANTPGAVRMLAQSFLRRAEALEREGREDIARGLLEEVLSLDLRRAPSGLRYALRERLEALRARGQR
jgi:hypothetical protein